MRPWLEGYVFPPGPENWFDRFFMLNLTDLMITILGLVVVLATCLIITLLKFR